MILGVCGMNIFFGMDNSSFIFLLPDGDEHAIIA
jgi:hypothetical protein